MDSSESAAYFLLQELVHLQVAGSYLEGVPLCPSSLISLPVFSPKFRNELKMPTIASELI